MITTDTFTTRLHTVTDNATHCHSVQLSMAAQQETVVDSHPNSQRWISKMNRDSSTLMLHLLVSILRVWLVCHCCGHCVRLHSKHSVRWSK